MLGWKNKPLSEQTEDLECLCHLMRTCGRILDTPNGKFRMDQYFERMDQVIESEKMPLRIRFMVQDVVDLRRNKWTTRRGGKDMERGPRTIQQASTPFLQVCCPLTSSCSELLLFHNFSLLT